MCGIFGVITKQYDKKRFKNACNIQSHRGPDFSAEYSVRLNDHYFICGHQRLSIIDLSESANQPMISNESGKVLVYNGEIYNYLELKQELEEIGCHFISGGDTEVLLHALDQWGIDKTTRKLNGMWAFACFDRKRNQLTLSRDRFGEKPLYYLIKNDFLIFSSEIKSLLEYCQIKFKLNYKTIKKYLEYGIINDDEDTFFLDIKQVLPANNIEVTFDGSQFAYKKYSYWNLNSSYVSKQSLSDHTQELYEKFRRSVKIRLRSDVPVGILLSGGLDSSSIATVAKEFSGTNLNILSAVSDHKEFDESNYINIMQRYLDCPVTKIKISESAEFLFKTLEKVIWHSDTPIVYMSSLAHYLLMSKAKEKKIKVILSGQGADELLCGYKKYLPFYLQDRFTKLDILEIIKTLYGFLNNSTFLKQFNYSDAKRYMPNFMKLGDSNVFGDAIYNEKSISVKMHFGSSLTERQLLDLQKYSVPTLNHFEDRMSMAHSREMRLPFLDHELVEHIMQSPSNFKIKKGFTKYSFRIAMQNKLPHEITWRKDKQGFINPQDEWIKNQLKENILEDYF